MMNLKGVLMRRVIPLKIHSIFKGHHSILQMKVSILIAFHLILSKSSSVTLKYLSLARLNSCLEEMRNILGDTTPEHILIEAALRADFNSERALNDVLSSQGLKQAFNKIQSCIWTFLLR
jgi:hypothetical protein